ncbi:unnamed protein product [Linum tenue]|nr:unnamed protein product [Linum tenue]
MVLFVLLTSGLLF